MNGPTHSAKHPVGKAEFLARRIAASLLLLLILSQGLLETAALGKRLVCGAPSDGAAASTACHSAEPSASAGCGASCSMSDGPCCCHGSAAPSKFAGIVLSPPGCRGGAAPYLPPYPASIEYRFLAPIEVALAPPALRPAPQTFTPTIISDFVSDIPTPPPRLA